MAPALVMEGSRYNHWLGASDVVVAVRPAAVPATAPEDLAQSVPAEPRGQDDGWTHLIWRLEPFPHVCLANHPSPPPPPPPEPEPKQAEVRPASPAGKKGKKGDAGKARPASPKGRPKSGKKGKKEPPPPPPPAEDPERDLWYGHIWRPPSREFVNTHDTGLSHVQALFGAETCRACLGEW